MNLGTADTTCLLPGASYVGARVRVRYSLWRAQALFDTRRFMRRWAVREWWT